MEVPYSERLICNDSRPCFGRQEDLKCKILSAIYAKDGDCPFCKPKSGNNGLREGYDTLKPIRL